MYAGKDGYASSEVASFPRADFSGEPKLVRVGTMNLKAQARDHNGAAGAIGESRCFEIRSAPTPPNKDYFEFKTPAHRAMTSSPPHSPKPVRVLTVSGAAGAKAISSQSPGTPASAAPAPAEAPKAQ